jgi:hypothetical protein
LLGTTLKHTRCTKSDVLGVKTGWVYNARRHFNSY